MRLCIFGVHELFREKDSSRNTSTLLDYLLTVRPEPVEGFCLVRHVPLVLNLSKGHHERSDFSKCNKKYKPFEKVKHAKFFGPDVDSWMGEKVLDQKLKQIRGPQILHIASHGFFKGKQKEDEHNSFNGLGDRGLSSLSIVGEKASLSSQGKKFENPLLLSWLALAGINTFLLSEEPVEGAEDGILTALNVTGMDLIGTDLVVLSACVSGLGEALPGEGIYGLRRAFTLAGARTLILSLWSVPDKQTKELMVTFYSKLRDGVPKAQALREAQREMLNAGYPPYYWGAFVCVGDPGKLGEPVTQELRLQTEHAESANMKESASDILKHKKAWWQFWKS